MTKIENSRFIFACLFSILLFSSSNQSFAMLTDRVSIKAGNAKLIGNITNSNNTGDIFVTLIVPNPISGGLAKHKVLVDRSGKFSIDAKIESNTALVGLYINLNMERPLLIRLRSDKVTRIDINYNREFNIEKVQTIPAMNQDDVTLGFQLMNKMIDYKVGRTPESMYNKSTNYFLNYAKTNLSEKLSILNKDTLVSRELKDVLSKDLRLFLYDTHVLPYEDEMMRSYGNSTGEKNKKPAIQKIDKSYFSFLKDFDLNDPEYLNCLTFQDFQLSLLRNEILDLPEIGDMDIPSWLAISKAVLADIIGFDRGQYYDILVANAYGRQLNEELKPLNERQIQNISRYWKNGEIAKILFRKNQEVSELSKRKSPVVINDISSVNDNKVIETILAKYKGKVVLIDFWATWCSPCLKAMQEFRTTKGSYKNKDVVFVYLTNTSSPKKLWEEKIKGIGNEHYYLQSSQWNYVMGHFGFRGIPSYLLYDKDGKVVNKFTSYPGDDEMKKMIDAIL